MNKLLVLPMIIVALFMTACGSCECEGECKPEIKECTPEKCDK